MASHAVVIVNDSPSSAEDTPAAEASARAARWFQNLVTPAFFIHKETLGVLDPNARAVAFLNEGKGIALSKSGALALVGRGATEGLRTLLQALDTHPVAHAIELRDGGYAVLRLETVADSNLASVVILSPDRPQVIWADTCAIFGLTPAEDRLIKQLMGGANIEEISTDLGISIETARTHVRRSYLKIGVTSREQLFAAMSPFRLPA